MAEWSIKATLKTLGRYVATDSRDWGQTPGNALLWAVLLGWDCEEEHVHDDDMCSSGTFQQIAQRHRWSAEFAETVQQMRRAVIGATTEPAPSYLFGADAHMAAGVHLSFPDCTWPEMQCVGHPPKNVAPS